MKDKGDYNGALSMLETCLAIEEKALGKDHPFTATTYNNMGRVMDAKGDYAGTLTMLEKCLAMREKALGKAHPKTRQAYRNIGVVKKRIKN